MIVSEEVQVACHHCGDSCAQSHPIEGSLDFCCEGCRAVYLLLSGSGLGDFYNVQPNAGLRIAEVEDDLSYLDDDKVIDLISIFRRKGICKISLNIPQIHCSACIWLLEHLDQLDAGVRSSRVNFLKKEVNIVFDESQTSLKELVRLLNKIGYGPRLNLLNLNESEEKTPEGRELLYKIGVAAFCFGNIMLLSFPEYLGVYKESWLTVLGYLNIFLALPILLYSGKDYLTTAFRSVKMGLLGIDLPIALGMLALFGRSVYEIVSKTGGGYLDSLSGFIFFLLIGRWFQQYTFQHISFEHDYRSFFPISVLKFMEDTWRSCSLQEVQEGDMIKVLTGRIIPCDGYIIKGEGLVDYSFVTGESIPVKTKKDEEIYAGGKQCGNSIEIRVTKKTEDGYLTQLWKEEIFNTVRPSGTSTIINKIGKYFTISILSISLLTFIYWARVDWEIAFQSFTAVLIIACPCVLALSIPFIYGNVIRVLATRGLYCKNTAVIERLTELNEVVFDKTGTITDTARSQAIYIGTPLSEEEHRAIVSLTSQSFHPFSQIISTTIDHSNLKDVVDFQEYLGKGLVGSVDNISIRIGSAQFILESNETTTKPCVFIEIGGKVKGHYEFENPLRIRMPQVLKKIAERGKIISLLSGDNKGEEKRMRKIFPANAELLFNQSPQDKLEYIRTLQDHSKGVMMIGDGLNDSGALKQSDVGLVVSQNDHFFAPSCDAIISATALSELDELLIYINRAKYILYGAFAFAALYNLIGLWFAVRGELSPVVAAILMPTSSISMILYGLICTSILGGSWKK